MFPFPRRQFLQHFATPLALALPAPAQNTPAPPRRRPIEFGTAKMVFCDWWFVEAGYGLGANQRPSYVPRGVRLRVGRPTLTPAPVVRPDGPVDGVYMGGYCTLLKDGGKYRLWYESYLAAHAGDESANICYAESDNGFDWKKPNVGIFEHAGSRNNNLVYRKGHGASIFIDPSAKPAERYKLIHLDKVPLQEYKGRMWEAFVFGAVSPDGLHWTRLAEPVVKHTSDTQSVAEYDPIKRKYVAYLRGWDPQTSAGYGGRRMVVRTESEDFRGFPDPQPVLTLGPEHPPDADIYTNAYQRWPGAARACLMTPAIYHRTSDRVDLQLATSRDGVRWHFPQSEPFLANGEIGSGHEGMIYAGRGTVELDGRTWAFPATVSSRTHNSEEPPEHPNGRQGGIWLATLRQDGYMAVEAEGEGEFWTQPSTFTGSRLLLNCEGLSGARVLVEIGDRNGKPAPGFSLAECDGLKGDQLWTPMTWSGKSDVSALRGETVRLRFQLSRARLHGFQFA
jgi:hypothetical protein